MERFVLLLFVMAATFVVIGAIRGVTSAKYVKRRAIPPMGRRDEIFDGVAPAVVPPHPDGAPVRRVGAADRAAPVAVRFNPPDGLAPEEGGQLIYGSPAGADVAAVFVAMAVGGWLSIERVEAQGRQKATWRLRRGARDPRELPARAVPIYQAIFETGPEVLLDDVKRSLKAPVLECRAAIPAALRERGLVAGSPIRPYRTALGTALRTQAVGFREYLATAEGRQLRFEEAAGVFSRYLPWAVGFGVADAWARHFADVARMVDDPAVLATWHTDLAWYVGMDAMLGGDLFDAMGAGIGDAFDSFGDAIGDAFGDFADGISDLAGDLGGDLGGDGGGWGGDGGGDFGGGDFGGGDFGGGGGD